MENHVKEFADKVLGIEKETSERSPVERRVMRKADCHINCHDCGRFLKRELWVAKDHPWKKHGLCSQCADNYDHYGEY